MMIAPSLASTIGVYVPSLFKITVPFGPRSGANTFPVFESQGKSLLPITGVLLLGSPIALGVIIPVSFACFFWRLSPLGNTP